jgi:hypothetical protein
MMPADLIALGLMAATTKADLPGLGRHRAAVAVGAAPASDLARLDELRLRRLTDPGTDLPRARDTLKPKRVGAMLDYFVDESGLRLSAGLRSAAKRKLSKGVKVSSLIYSPAQVGAMPYRANFKRQEAAITLGWSLPVAAGAVLGVEAGTALANNNGRTTSASIAQPRLSSGSWSRLDAVAQVALAFKL